jgi:hypothetical protein
MYAGPFYEIEPQEEHDMQYFGSNRPRMDWECSSVNLVAFFIYEFAAHHHDKQLYGLEPTWATKGKTEVIGKSSIASDRIDLSIRTHGSPTLGVKGRRQLRSKNYRRKQLEQLEVGSGTTVLGKGMMTPWRTSHLLMLEASIEKTLL